MKKLYIIIIIVVIFFASTFSAYADEAPQRIPFSILSEDETRVFFFNPGQFGVWDDVENWVDFPATGVYYNTTPPALIYLVENQHVLHTYRIGKMNIFFLAIWATS